MMPLGGSFKFSQSRKKMAAPFEERIGIRFPQHVTVGVLVQGFEDGFLGGRERPGTFLVEERYILGVLF